MINHRCHAFLGIAELFPAIFRVCGGGGGGKSRLGNLVGGAIGFGVGLEGKQQSTNVIVIPLCVCREQLEIPLHLFICWELDLVCGVLLLFVLQSGCISKDCTAFSFREGMEKICFLILEPYQMDIIKYSFCQCL